MKVLGKGQLPEQPVIVKARLAVTSCFSRRQRVGAGQLQARYFTKEAEEKIKAAGSEIAACV